MATVNDEKFEIGNNEHLQRGLFDEVASVTLSYYESFCLLPNSGMLTILWFF